MTKFDINTKYSLPSGYEIPVLGYGVYQTPADQAEEVTSYALKLGYRHVDSAVAYRNEEPSAAALKKSGIPRNELFFTSKVPPKQISYEGAKDAIKGTFERTGLEYIDLYLLHAPYGGKEGRLGAWRALVEAQQEGKIRSIGVSNYGVHHLQELEDYIKSVEAKEGKGKGGVISVGQYELHPWLTRPLLVEWCKARGIILEAYAPITRGTRFEDPALQKLAKKFNKSPAQILLRWSLQKGFVPLPKSVTHKRIEENADIFDFELSRDDLDSLTTNEYSPCCWDPTTSQD
ncbi:Aldo/keto reductase [Xylona heveae TC161]|uniref:Aldo/keto reductase n=1 Tax=Xylona heveae (strain CBS 132557 / TC161) TaxID=1328760 RepID=A0A165I7J1_XYLHT|nr:Aldo/keto reductase [Xylona heveae TC161]KZF24501.1 Aldo/keto reductase [Xylona heveae TC161]